MNRSFIAIIALLCSLAASARERVCFDSDWKFILGDSAQMASPEYNDAHWRKLNVPHDWAIEGDFYAGNPSGASGGALPGGIGWYRKHFQVSSRATSRDLSTSVEMTGLSRDLSTPVEMTSLSSRPSSSHVSFRACREISRDLSTSCVTLVASEQSSSAVEMTGLSSGPSSSHVSFRACREISRDLSTSVEMTGLSRDLSTSCVPLVASEQSSSAVEMTEWNPSDLLFLEFDGVYMNSTVYVNGHEVGFRPYGYSSFEYDITPYVHEGENVVAVRVDNSDQPNSRWYSGCGIYRHVWLTKTNPIHIKHWGVYIHDGKVEVDYVNPTNQRVKVVNELLDANGKPVPLSFRASTPMSFRASRALGFAAWPVQDISGDLSTPVEMTGLSRDLSTPMSSRPKRRDLSTTLEMTGLSRDLSTTLEMTIGKARDISTLKKWSCESPYIYKVRTQLIAGGKVVDEVETTTGFRDFRFDAKTGFWLNGKNFKINGVCEHHDFGCLGAALSEDALHRKLVKLKAMGVNAIRCSHNPPAPELLNMCDTMGLIVMDESFDMWRRKKTQNDYARFFDEWHERDLTDLILRDRNHPSVLMWSIGNEVLEQWSSADADTLTLEQANLILNAGHDASTLAKDGELSVQSLLTQHLAEIVRRYDTTRPITAGCNEPSPNNHLFKSGAIDIIGFNYHHENVKDVPRNFPGKPFIFSESVSALQSRGYYMMPSDSIYKAPKQWWLPYTDPSFMCSAYDNMHASWSSTHEETWDVVKHNAFVGGQFIWTGFDYIGEPTPYGFPARSSYFGLIDLAGFPKDSYYMYQSEWTDKPMLHLFPHWNWLPGQEIDLWAYYNQADEAELFINGKSQGVRKKLRNVSSRPSPPMSSRPSPPLSSRASPPLSSRPKRRDLSTTLEMTEAPDGALTTEVGGGGRMTEAPGEDGTLMTGVVAEGLSTEYHVAWRVRFTPGEIKVVTRKSGKEVCTQTIRTAGAPDHIRLSVDYKGKDLTFITAEIVDKDGNLCPWADNQIHFLGNVVATDNGCQTSMERFTAPTRRTFHGKCLVIVRGSGTLAAQSIDLGHASLNF